MLSLPLFITPKNLTQMNLQKLTRPTAIAGLVSLLFFIGSCTGGLQHPDTDFSRKLDSIDHHYPLSKAKMLAEAFKQHKDSVRFGGDLYAMPYSETFNLSMANQLTELKNCVGVRIYYGLDEKEKKVRLMIVGVDENGFDIYLPEEAAAQGGNLKEKNAAEQSVAETGQWGPPPPYSVDNLVTQPGSNTALLNK
jgi:hypothetical protein